MKKFITMGIALAMICAIAMFTCGCGTTTNAVDPSMERLAADWFEENCPGETYDEIVIGEIRTTTKGTKLTTIYYYYEGELIHIGVNGADAPYEQLN